MKQAGFNSIRTGSTSQRIKFLVKDSALYGVASAVSRMLSVFTVPILARIFSKTEFGVIDGITAFGAIFVPLIIMGQDSAVARFFYEHDDENERKQIISQAFFSEVIFILAVSLPLYLYAGLFLQIFFSGPAYVKVFKILVVSLPFQVLVNFSQNILKWTFARVQFLIISLGSSALVVLLTLYLILYQHQGIEGVFYAQLFGRGIFSVLGLFFCRKYLVAPKHLKYVMPMLSFGWPYMLVAVLMMIVPTIDRYFIINFLSLELMGVYAIGYKLVSLIQLVISGFQTAWGPFSFSIYKEKNACETYNSVLLYFVIVISIMAYLLVALARPLIYVFASAKYLDSAIVLLPLVFSKLVDSVSWITGVGISLSKRTSVNVLCYFIGTATAAILIWALVKPFGIVGVAYGVLGGQVVLTVSRTWFANRLYHLRFKVIPATVFLSISFIFSLTAQTLNGRSWFIQVGSNAVLLSSMVVLALWLARRKKAITIIKGLI